MKKWRAAVGLCLTLAVIGALLIPAAADATSTLAVSTALADKGSQVTLDVTWQGGDISGAELELQYDPAVLKPVSAEGGDALTAAGGTLMSNLRYSQNSISLGAMSANNIQSGVLCRVTFQLLESAPLALSAVTPVNTAVYDSDVQPVEARLSAGGVQPRRSGVAVGSGQAVAGQVIILDLTLTGQHTPAGGEFVICYDTGRFSAATVAKNAMVSGLFLDSREESAGRVKVSWLSQDPLSPETLLGSVALTVRTNAFGQGDITIEDLAAYDEDAKALDTQAQGGTVTVVEPDGDSPKLWVVGGSVDETGCAQVGIVVEDRGVICGGQFLLTYPTTGCKLESITVAEGLTAYYDPKAPAGQLSFGWANAEPNNSSTRLVTLAFSGVDLAALGEQGALTLSRAETYDQNGVSSGKVDIRSGKLLPDTLALQTPIVDKAVIASGASTEVELQLDVADASVFKAGTAVEDGRLILGLYEDGRMKTVELADDNVQFNFDENGITQIQIAASCAGAADTARLFMLDNDAQLVPLAQCGNYELAELNQE